MKIWITRHGQTDLNHAKLMQGRTDAPLNATGIRQAEEAHKKIEDVHFDAVYASPLSRAMRTAAIIGGVPENEVIVDERLIEVDFGNYEKKKYYLLGPAMTLYWLAPNVFPVPGTVEPISSMVERSSSFLRELEQKDYENVLVTCHGGIIRALCGYMEDRPNGIRWHPHPRNCEIRVYESVGGKHKLLKDING
ncbi:MAG: histidine phosphatase family protein [Lachnospiraceae bacterium]|nr:histidine phosphatase family protein [Lachnospiraceae bacterium]